MTGSPTSRRLGGRWAPSARAALLETALLRARAVGRFPDGWLWTGDALEQATAWPVAEHRAARLAAVVADRVVADVTCSVGVETAVLSAALGRVVGSDLDPVRLAMARANVPGARLVRADALAPAVRPGSVLVADPARRTASRPARPPAGGDDAALDGSRRGRLWRNVEARHDWWSPPRPGSTSRLVPWAREVELVSLDGRVREAALWSAGLVTRDGPTRRATVLRCEGAGYELTDADDDTCPVRDVGEWLVDPDGAVVRAGLVRQFAARHGLGQLDPHLAYLTGDDPPPVGAGLPGRSSDGPYAEKIAPADPATPRGRPRRDPRPRARRRARPPAAAPQARRAARGHRRPRPGRPRRPGLRVRR